MVKQNITEKHIDYIDVINISNEIQGSRQRQDFPFGGRGFCPYAINLKVTIRKFEIYYLFII
jgi:hypothetical protein